MFSILSHLRLWLQRYSNIIRKFDDVTTCLSRKITKSRISLGNNGLRSNGNLASVLCLMKDTFRTLT